MEKNRRQLLRNAIKQLQKTKDEIDTVLSIAGFGESIIDEIGCIVKNSDKNEQKRLIIFLNFFCMGSPKAMKKLESNIRQRFSKRAADELLNELKLLGFKLHTEFCRNG